MLVLSQSDVESLLDLDRLIEALAPAMAALSAGAVSLPPRTVAQVQEFNGLLGLMPVYLPENQTLATKLVSVYPDNHALGMPSHQALVVVFNSATGSPAAVMDGGYLTAMRTAAGSALATRLVARPEADTLLIVGTGVQAWAHARLLPRVRPILQVLVLGREVHKAEALARRIENELGLRAEAVASFEQGARQAGIVCACTHSAQPVVLGEMLEPGTHVNSVGLNGAGRELDAETVLKSQVFVESRAAALAPAPSGANDLTWPIRDGLVGEDHIQAEIGELVSGEHPGRSSAGQITLYKSVGVAVQDAVAARLVLDAARAQGLGREIAI